MSDRNAAKERLKAQLSELEARQQRIAVDLSEPLDADLTEQAVEVEDDAGLEAEAALVRTEIASVKRALERVRTGTYGKCAQCGDDVAPARLQARPEAALCIDCAGRR